VSWGIWAPFYTYSCSWKISEDTCRDSYRLMSSCSLPSPAAYIQTITPKCSCSLPSRVAYRRLVAFTLPWRSIVLPARPIGQQGHAPKDRCRQPCWGACRRARPLRRAQAGGPPELGLSALGRARCLEREKERERKRGHALEATTGELQQPAPQVYWLISDICRLRLSRKSERRPRTSLLSTRTTPQLPTPIPGIPTSRPLTKEVTPSS
jgi:hypothetical protein